MNKIYLGSDHAGFKAKEEIKKILKNKNIDFEDIGTFNEESVDYPDYAKEVALKTVKSHSLGILICGSGTGMQIAANKIKGARAAFCFDEYSAKMAREDNDANILTLRAREFDHKKYEEIILTFLKTNFSNKPRHKNRIKKITHME